MNKQGGAAPSTAVAGSQSLFVSVTYFFYVLCRCPLLFSTLKTNTKMTHTEFFEATGHEVSAQYFEQKLLPDFTDSGLTADMWLHNYCMNLTFYTKWYAEWLLAQIESLKLQNANLLSMVNNISAQRDEAKKELFAMKDKEFNRNYELKCACYHQAGRIMESSEYAEELFASAQENETLRNILLRNWEEAQQKKAS